MADVFISYRNLPERRAYARRLATILRAHGIEVWWDFGLAEGESYRQQITDELGRARVVVPLWCAESILSKWVAMEAEFGRDKLLPVRLQNVAPPDAFEAIHAADLIGWDGTIGPPGCRHSCGGCASGSANRARHQPIRWRSWLTYRSCRRCRCQSRFALHDLHRWLGPGSRALRSPGSAALRRGCLVRRGCYYICSGRWAAGQCRCQHLEGHGRKPKW